MRVDRGREREWIHEFGLWHLCIRSHRHDQLRLAHGQRHLVRNRVWFHGRLCWLLQHLGHRHGHRDDHWHCGEWHD